MLSFPNLFLYFIEMKTWHIYYVYIVECRDGLYYTGVTNNVEVRVAQHNDGINPKCLTYKRRPVVLRYWQEFYWIQHAIEWEKQLKGWSRKKKEALFKEDWDTIRKLASIRYGEVGKAWRKDKGDSEQSQGSSTSP